MKRTVALGMVTVALLYMVGCGEQEKVDTTQTVKEEITHIKKSEKALNHEDAKKYIKTIADQFKDSNKVEISDDGLILAISGDNNEQFVLQMKLCMEQDYIAHLDAFFNKDISLESVSLFSKIIKHMSGEEINGEELKHKLTVGKDQIFIGELLIKKETSSTFSTELQFKPMELKHYTPKDYTSREYEELKELLENFSNEFRLRVDEQAGALGYSSGFVSEYWATVNDHADSSIVPGYNLVVTYSLPKSQDDLSEEEITFREDIARQYSNEIMELFEVDINVENAIAKAKSVREFSSKTKSNLKRHTYPSTESIYKNVDYRTDGSPLVIYPITVDGVANNLQ